MEDEDRNISDLPDLILGRILSFRPTKEAVGASILSSRWRYLFALLPNLDFEFDGGELCGKKLEISCSVNSFSNFVDRVLFFHDTCLDKFRLKCGKMVDSRRVCGWISAAVWHGVQHLDLSMSHDKFITLPAVLFTCRTLVTLKLDIGFILDLPKGVIFPNLKTLHLKSVVFANDDSVESLFCRCSSLEDMVIEKCQMWNISHFKISHHLLKRLTILYSDFLTYDYWLMIDTPNLVYFKYVDHVVAGYSLENLQSLVEAEIVIFNNRKDLQADAIAFFRGISNVRSLTLASSSLKLLSSCETVPVFSTMVDLKICCDPRLPSCKYKCLKKGLATLLSSSHELENIAFDQEFLRSLPGKVLYCLLFKVKLKAIEISNFKDDKDCIEKVELILKNGRALEKLTIRTASKLSEAKESKLSELLLDSARESNQCCLLII